MKPLSIEEVQALEAIIEYYEDHGAVKTACLIYHALSLAKLRIEEPPRTPPDWFRFFAFVPVN